MKKHITSLIFFSTLLLAFLSFKSYAQVTNYDVAKIRVHQPSGNIYVNVVDLDIKNLADAKITNNGTITTKGDIINHSEFTTTNPQSLLKLDRNGDQKIEGLTLYSFLVGNIRFEGTGNKDLYANLKVEGNLWVNGVLDFRIYNSSEINLQGTNSSWFVDAGTFNSGTGLVEFRGTGLQQVKSGGSSNKFYKINVSTQNNTDEVRIVTNDLNIAQELTLAQGELDLNRQTLTIENQLASAIVRHATTDYGYIYAETTPQSWENIVRWNIKNNTNTYIVPFGKSNTQYIPVTLEVTSNNMNSGTGYVDFSTYGTIADNTPLPIGVALPSPSNTDFIVDRYWYVDYATKEIAGNLTFTYLASELDGVIEDTDMIAQRYNTTNSVWGDVFYTQDALPTTMPIVGNSVLNSTAKTFKTGLIVKEEFFNVWVLTNMDNPLPIDLISFDARCLENGIEVLWSTATEINNHYFTIERSKDGVNWYEVAKVQGANNSSTQNNYSIIDKHPFTGWSYYRLTQTDYDGNSQIFTPIDINCRIEQQADLLIYPNPFSNNLTISFLNLPASNAQLKVYDALGRIIINRAINEIESGQGTIVLDLYDLASGIYYVKFISDEFIRTEKITKNKN